MDRGPWKAAVHGVAKSQTRLSDFTLTFHFDALEKEMATHSSILAWRIPGMGEPGGLLSMGSHRVGHDWSDLAAAYTSFFLFYKAIFYFILFSELGVFVCFFFFFGHTVQHAGSWFPNQGLNPHTLHRKHGANHWTIREVPSVYHFYTWFS